MFGQWTYPPHQKGLEGPRWTHLPLQWHWPAMTVPQPWWPWRATVILKRDRNLQWIWRILEGNAAGNCTFFQRWGVPIKFPFNQVLDSSRHAGWYCCNNRPGATSFDEVGGVQLAVGWDCRQARLICFQLFYHDVLHDPMAELIHWHNLQPTCCLLSLMWRCRGTLKLEQKKSLQTDPATTHIRHCSRNVLPHNFVS